MWIFVSSFMHFRTETNDIPFDVLYIREKYTEKSNAIVLWLGQVFFWHFLTKKVKIWALGLKFWPNLSFRAKKLETCYQKIENFDKIRL